MMKIWRRTDTDSYPKSIFFIIGNEFCERFSYYGMRTVLIIYLTSILAYEPNQATVIYHAFTIACYFTPLLGAIISDSWLGKFKTILYISFIYAIGNVTIAVGSIPGALQMMKILSLIGLGLIAIGTGGIKPCVSAFGGDQFKPGQEHYRERFFSYFYLAINLGSTISTFITPILRNDIHCFGSMSCFPLAFGVPAILMIVSLMIFWCGKPLYKINPPEGNVLSKVTKCCAHAISTKAKTKAKNKEHWLDYANDKYDKKFIEEIKTVLRVLLLFVPLPVFWALFDQQGSRWTLQATQMSGKMLGWTMQPDQMQVVNPFLIIVLIPTFQYFIYPAFSKCNFLTRPLQRITIGGMIAATAFVYAGFLEMHLETNFPTFPETGMSELMVINNSPCTLGIKGHNNTLEPFSEFSMKDIKLGTLHKWSVESECLDVREATINFNSSQPIETLMITIVDKAIAVDMFEDTKEKSKKGFAKIRVLYNFNLPRFPNDDLSFLFDGGSKFVLGHKNSLTYGATDYIEVPSDTYKLYSNNDTFLKTLEFGEGGNYIVTVFEDLVNREGKIDVKVYTFVMPNTVSLLYQLPQYFLITVGEIMFSITGLEFSYSQAPQSMKSVLQAAWLLTVAFGNLIVLIIAELEIFDRQSYEFFLFATLMGVDMLIFGIMASFYKYAKYEDSSEKEIKSGKVSDPPPYIEVTYQRGGKTNMGYDEDTKF